MNRAHLLLACLVLGLGACSEKATEKKGPPPTLITVTQVKVQPVEVVETTLGSLEAYNDPKIAAEVPGRLTKLHVHAGEVVKQGQVIAEIDPADIAQQSRADQADIRRVEALLGQQERLLKRQSELVQKGFVSKNALDDAAAQRDALLSQRESAQARAALSANNLRKARIVAPFDGAIEKQVAAVGEYLKLGDTIVTLVSNRQLRANLPFPETAAHRLKIGQEVRLTSPLFPGRQIKGTLEDVRPVLTEGSRAVEAVARIDNPEDVLKGGGSVNAVVVIEVRDAALMVPEQSVVLRPAGKVVYVITEGKAVQRLVKTGSKQSGFVEILEGLKADETVAFDGAGFLSDGGVVTIQDRSAQTAPVEGKKADKPASPP